jgi:ubiquitin carboxyl-terminal hydrolase L5
VSCTKTPSCGTTTLRPGLQYPTLGRLLDKLHTGHIADRVSLGETLASSDHIREVHNSFSKSSPFSLDPSLNPSREKEDAYHFVTYLPVNGVLYELDGLRRDPVMHAAVDDSVPGGWLEQARETIEARIGTYPPGSVSDSEWSTIETLLPSPA